ncbi:hypothetical protein pdam_00023181 [Pocillopora damicornis]|uniref:Uncharacterized protein n=1 Tax=Pocillopora damicornis TaxID=46731 RepID=A0A3M6T5R9_POCDA|nr:hypothetical protein pdam_00023181 [Pocillopora damicornis]
MNTPLLSRLLLGANRYHMTEQWRKAIRHRNKLWRLFMRDRTDANYDHYKIQRNICTSLRRLAIKEHFMKKSSETENPREFWNAYRSFLHGKTKQANDTLSRKTIDKREIAELFNAHFIQIADDLPLMKEADYGQHFENHPSIKAIHEKNSAKDAPLLNNSIDIFGMTIDNRLSFDNHVSVICKKINNQFNVMLRFRKLINKETLSKLYKAFILPHFYYCSSVWHFCGARNADKVDNLNERILRRLQNFMITLYKSLFFKNYPGYLKDMFTVRSSSYNLRGNHIMSLPNPKTTTYGLHSFSYLASKIWNSLPDTYRTLNFLEFKLEILRYEAFPQQI